jgi:hypothetical protein
MGADASIYQQFLQPVRSVQDYGADMDKRDLLKLQLQGQQGQNALLDITRQGTAQKAQQEIDDRNALQRAAMAWKPDTPVSERAASLRATGRPGLFTVADQLETQDIARRKGEGEIGNAAAKTANETAKTAAETADAAVKRFRGALDFIDTPQGAQRWLQAQYSDPVLGAHMRALGTPEESLSRVPTDPAQFQQWRQQAAMGMEAYAKKAQEDAKIAETGRHNVSTENISVGNNAATIAGENQRAAAARAQALQLANRGVVHDTDAGTVLIDPRSGKATPITNPATGEMLGKPLKPLPPTVNEAVIGNAQSLYTLDKAIALLSGKNVDSAKGDAAATGWKGYLPQAVLNRVDPTGVDTRAEVADIGSLKIHDRSGAAVTISESPRLMPFIPQATDPPDVAVKKLTRLREEADRNQKALAETYSKEQGYKPSPVKPADVKASTDAGLPPAVAAALAKHGVK